MIIVQSLPNFKKNPATNTKPSPYGYNRMVTTGEVTTGHPPIIVQLPPAGEKQNSAVFLQNAGLRPAPE